MAESENVKLLRDAQKAAEQRANESYVLGNNDSVREYNALSALFGKISWMIGLDPDLAGRIGVDETLTLARAVLRRWYEE